MHRVLALALVACGSSQPPPAPVGPPAPLEAQRGGPDDVIVAKVDGRPVWGSCVAVQAARTHATRDEALRQCIDFELLAQAAEKRGFATHPEVAVETRTAMVSQLVASAYEDRFDRRSDFGPFWDLYVQRSGRAFQFQHGELRASTYVRVPIKDKPPADDPEKHALAQKIADAVAGERGLVGSQLVAIAKQLTPIVPCKPLEFVPCTQDVPLGPASAHDKSYADALWAIPEIGRASALVRTQLGWDVIVWTDVEPAADPSPAELVRALLPEIKTAYFESRWVWSRSAPGDLAKALGIHAAIDPHADALLEALP